MRPGGGSSAGDRGRVRAARAWAPRAAWRSAAARGRRPAPAPRRGRPAPAACPASRRCSSIPAAGVARGRQAIGHRVQAQLRRPRRRGPRPTPAGRTRGRPAWGAPSRPRPRCGRARSGCSPRTRRGAPPSTTWTWPGRGRGARPRGPGPGRRGAPRRSPSCGSMRTKTWMPLEPDVLGNPIRPCSSSTSRATIATRRTSSHEASGVGSRSTRSSSGWSRSSRRAGQGLKSITPRLTAHAKWAASLQTSSVALRPLGKVTVAVCSHSGVLRGHALLPDRAPPRSRRRSASSPSGARARARAWRRPPSM